MGPGIGYLDVSPLPAATHHHTESSPPPSSLSSLDTLTLIIIVLLSILILSISLYILRRRLSRRHSSSTSAAPPLSNPSLPLFKFSSLPRNNIQTADCAICLASFERTDQLRLLPLCCHAFHAHCIDMWLSSSHDTCPLCRSTVYPIEADVPDKIPPTLSRGNSYRIEIGSLSQHRHEGLQRSYSVGPLEYVVEESYEVPVESCQEKEVVAEAPASFSVTEATTSFPAAGEGFGGGEVAGRSWLMDYMDRLGSFSSRTFSRRGSGRFWNGSVRRSEGLGRVEDLEANRVGEEISEIFRWLSGV